MSLPHFDYSLRNHFRGCTLPKPSDLDPQSNAAACSTSLASASHVDARVPGELGTTVVPRENVREFKEHGYTTVPGFFAPDEVRAMQAEVARWHRAGRPRDVSTDPATRQNLQLIPLHDKSSLFRALPFAPKVRSAVA